MATTTDAQTTLTLTLPPEQTAQVNRLVAEGRYASPEEAVNQMILQALEYESDLTSYTPSAKAHVQAGIEASLRGEVVHHDKIEGFLDDWERELQHEALRFRRTCPPRPRRHRATPASGSSIRIDFTSRTSHPNLIEVPMATLQISDELDAELQQAADLLGCSKHDLLREAVTARLEEHSASHSDFTEEQIARMKHSLAQLDRGEVVTSQHVDTMFEEWRNRRATR